MSSYSESEAYSDVNGSEHPQLEYILEYVTSAKDIHLPAASLHDLLSLVCEEPSQPKKVPPYLLVAGCRAVFTPDLKSVFFEESVAALKQLDLLETIRSRYVSALRSSKLLAAKSFPIDKIDRETLKMYFFTWVALRRWTIINELQTDPFTASHCLALINVLYAPSQQYHEVPRERMAITTLLQKAKQQVSKTGSVHGCVQLGQYKTSLPYEKAYTAMNRYLDLSQSLIARIEDILQPMPADLRAMGIKKSECAIHRIAKHLIHSSADGYQPEERGTQESGFDSTQQSQEMQQHKRRRIESPEI